MQLKYAINNLIKSHLFPTKLHKLCIFTSPYCLWNTIKIANCINNVSLGCTNHVLCTGYLFMDFTTVFDSLYHSIVKN